MIKGKKQKNETTTRESSVGPIFAVLRLVLDSFRIDGVGPCAATWTWRLNLSKDTFRVLAMNDCVMNRAPSFFVMFANKTLQVATRLLQTTDKKGDNFTVHLRIWLQVVAVVFSFIFVI